jgi:hypothetical protein
MHKLIFLLLFGLSLGAGADTLYKWVDKDGTVHYSDNPDAKNAEVFKPPELSAYKSVSVSSTKKPSQKANGDASADAANISGFTILAPQEEETIISNQGIFSFKISTGARQEEGDFFKLEIDGKLINRRHTNSIFSVTSLERGAHKARVFRFDKDNKLIAETSIRTFYLRKASIHDPQRKKPNEITEPSPDKSLYGPKKGPKDASPFAPRYPPVPVIPAPKQN